jgi:hypothetical protein
VAEGGRQKCVLTGAASRIEDTANQVSGLGQSVERWLWSPNVPGGWFLRRIDGIEVVTWGASAVVTSSLLQPQSEHLPFADSCCVTRPMVPTPPP